MDHHSDRPLKAEALLAFPEDRSKPAPLVIAQHGIGSFPERVFGVDDPTNLYPGKKDGIAWWPQALEELEASQEHYRKLGIEDHIGIDLHEGGHEIRIDSGLAFLKRWLMR